MEMKTAELQGRALIYATALVADRISLAPERRLSYASFLSSLVHAHSLSTLSFNPLEWSDGGPLIDKYDIHWGMSEADGAKVYIASVYRRHTRPLTGPTAVIASMRCLVDMLLGDTVDVPDNLVG